MRALVLCAIVTCGAACGYPEKVLIDGMGTPFGCLNAPPPTTADNPVTLSGTVTDPFTLNPVANAAVAGQLPGVPTSVFVAHTDAMGQFSQRQNTNGTPLDLYLFASSNGYISTYYYPARPITHDVASPIQLLTATDAATIAGAAQVTFQASDGQLLLTVNDCNDQPVAGATITTTPAGTIRYFNGVRPSTTATATDMQAVVLVANLPPGDVTLSATFNGMNFKSHNFQVVADAFIQTQIQP